MPIRVTSGPGAACGVAFLLLRAGRRGAPDRHVIEDIHWADAAQREFERLEVIDPA